MRPFYNRAMHPPDLAQAVPTAEPRPKILLGILFALWLLLYGSFTLLAPPLLDDADSVHAEVAREMLVRHDPVTLYANGIRYLEKAPLLYWSMAASFRLLGVSTEAARLPLAFYILALLLIAYAMGRQLFPRSLAGFYAALILATSFGLFIFTRILIPDAILCLWTTLAVFCFWRSLQEATPSLATAAGFAAACALNVLTKGLIGVVFPVAIVLCFLFLTRNLGHLRRWHPLMGLLIFFALAAPWHIAAGLANPTQGHPHGLAPTQGNVRGFFWFYFVNEHLLRYINQRIPRDYDTVPLLLFWGLLLVWLMPWSAFLLAALRRIPLRLVLRRALLKQLQQARLLLTLWAAIPMLFFSFSTRQEYYVLPALPPLALLIGNWLAEDEQDAQQNPDRQSRKGTPTGRRIAWFLVAVGWAGAAAALFFALHGKTLTPGSDLAAVLAQNPTDYALSFGHFLDLSSAAMSFFRGPLLDVAAALALGTLAHLYYRLRGRPRVANFFLAGMTAVFLIAAHLALVTFSPVLSSRALAAAVAAPNPPQRHRGHQRRVRKRVHPRLLSPAPWLERP